MAAPSSQDFIKGIDATVQPNASAFNQLVEVATPYTDKGLIVETTDTGADTPEVPNAAVTTKWKQYIWKRIRTDGGLPSIYIWNDALGASDATYLKWQFVASISGGVLNVGTMVALRAIKHNNLAAGQLCFLRKYTDVSNDRGGGLFIWNSTSIDVDDGGRYIIPHSAPATGRSEE